MNPFIVVWNGTPGIAGNNVTVFDTEEEAREFGEHLISLNRSYSVWVCSVLRYYLHERKRKAAK